MANEINLQFGDGEYRFYLGMRQITELQTKCNAGIGEIYARILAGRYVIGADHFGNAQEAKYRVEDLVETLRLGLIGGGGGVVNGAPVIVNPVRAQQLIESYAFTRPLDELWKFAASVLFACIQGYEPDKKKEPAQEAKKSRRRGAKSPAMPQCSESESKKSGE